MNSSIDHYYYILIHYQIHEAILPLYTTPNDKLGCGPTRFGYCAKDAYNIIDVNAPILDATGYLSFLLLSAVIL